MTPAKLTARRAELLREADGHHASMLAVHRDMRVCQARLSEIDFAIAACADCAVGGEAGEGIEASMATSGAPGAESASAGEFELGGQSLGAVTDERLDDSYPALGNVSESPSTKKRAPKRDIRGMVLEDVHTQPGQTLDELSRALGVPFVAVKKAVAYWQAKERVTLAGGVVLMRTKEPEPPASPPEMMLADREPEAEAQQSEAAE